MTSSELRPLLLLLSRGFGHVRTKRVSLYFSGDGPGTRHCNLEAYLRELGALDETGRAGKQARGREADGGRRRWEFAACRLRLELRTLDQVPGLWLKAEGSGSNASAFCREPGMPGFHVQKVF